MDRPECGYSGSPEHEATLCLCGYRDTCVPYMYFLLRESSVDAGWEERKRRRDGEEVGWMGVLRMERRKEAIEEEGVLGNNLGTLRGMWGPETEGKKKFLCSWWVSQSPKPETLTPLVYESCERQKWRLARPGSDSGQIEQMES